MNMGDLPTWIEAITTSGTLIAALLLFRLQSSALRKSLEESSRKSRYPAARMCLWKSTGPAGCAVHVLNASELPVTGVRVTCEGGELNDEPLAEFSSLFPPGKLEECRLQTAPSQFETVRVSMVFVDVFGNRWRRAPDSIECLGSVMTVNGAAGDSGKQVAWLRRWFLQGRGQGNG